MLEGTCHCGTMKWTYNLPLESVTACNCTLCRRYGALWAYGHLNEGIEVSGRTKIYERESKVSSYHHCEKCGCIGFYIVNTKDKEGRHKIAVNLRMINEPDKIADLPIDHFDGLDKFEDLPRDGRCVKDLWF